jgi:hypothetical protein
MILYNLPSGKAVWISVDRLLNLTHADIQDYEASSIGQTSNDPFINLPTSSSEFKQFIDDQDDEDSDYSSTDLLSDGDDISYEDIDINNIPDN